MKVFKEIGDLQKDYKEIKKQKKLTKKIICNLVIPFRDKYNLTDIQALQIARSELTIDEIISILEEENE